MSIAVGVFLKLVRMTVRPASCSRIAASRWPSNVESIRLYCQAGEVYSVRMP